MAQRITYNLWEDKNKHTSHCAINWLFKHQPRKNGQTHLNNCLCVFDHFVGLALKGLMEKLTADCMAPQVLLRP